MTNFPENSSSQGKRAKFFQSVKKITKTTVKSASLGVSIFWASRMVKPMDPYHPLSSSGDLNRSLNQDFINHSDLSSNSDFQKTKENVNRIRMGDKILISKRTNSFPLYSETEEFKELFSFLEDSMNNFEIGKDELETVILVGSRNYDPPEHVSFGRGQKKSVLAKLKNEKKWPKAVKRRLLRDSKLWELSYDPLKSEIKLGLFEEAETMLQAQKEIRTGFFRSKLFTDLRKPLLLESTLDFILYGPNYNEGDSKRPVVVYDNGKQIPRETLLALARELGKSSIVQKGGSEKCLHILDLRNIPRHLKRDYKRNFFKGAIEQAKIEENINLARHIFVING